MPRVDLYQGDRIRTQPPAKQRQTVVPTAEVFGATVAEAEGNLWGSVAQAAGQTTAVVNQFLEEQRKRANELVQTTAARQFNQLFQVNGLGTERGTMGTRGLFTMEGIEPQEKLEANLKDYDAQAEEIVKAAKTPEQRLLLEQMRDRERARYVDAGMRHASAELGKYESKQTEALRISNMNMAAAAAGTPGGLEIVADMLARNDALIDQQGAKLGFYSPEQQAVAKAQTRSDTHVLVVHKLMTAGEDIAAEQYFDRVMEKSDTHQPEILESQAAALREKVKTNSTWAWATREGQRIWDQIGPKPGDPAPIRTADLQAAARAAAGDNKKRYDALTSDLTDRAQAVTSQRNNVDAAHLETLYSGFWRETPLAQLKQTPAFQNATPTTQAKLVTMYENREQNRLQEARQARGAVIAEYNFQQFQKEQSGWGLYYELTDPKVLGPIKDRGRLLERIGDNLSSQQMQAVMRQWETVQSGLAGGAGVTLEREIFTQVAMETLGDWVALPPGQQTNEQRAALGRLQGLVLTAVAQKEQERAEKTGRRTALDPLEQRAITQEIASRTVMVPGMLWGSNEKRAVMVEQDQVGTMFVQWDRIAEEDRILMRDEIKKAPLGAGVVSTRTMQDTEIDQRYRGAMERAYAVSLRGGGKAEWVKILNEAVAAVRHRTPTAR